jgi:hypothetical protein
MRSRHLAPLRSLLVVWLAVIAAGTGGCGGDDDDGTDESTVADAALAFPDAEPVICNDFAAPDLGALDPIAAATTEQSDNPDPPEGNADAKVIDLTGTAANGQQPDLISIELWDGLGAFEGGDAVTGTFTIAGDEAQVVTCGVCVYIHADATVADGSVVDTRKDYIATGGTVTIDSVTGNFTGSVADLTFTEIDWTNALGGPLAGGCETAVPSATFDVAITVE